MKAGDVIGAYRIQGRLGEGGMGIVWEATRIDSAETVVIKGIQVLQGGDPQLRKRLGREAKILLSLEHPNIVRALEVFVHADEAYLVLERVAGTTMANWLKADPAPALRERLTAVRQILSALDYAHAKGVTHRDLKPANVMVSPGPVAKVLDFGLARALDSTRLTRTGVVMGTLSYMAPEQARQAPVDGRADLFSAGMLLARSLLLTAPFRRGSPMTIYGRLVSPDPIQLDAWLPDDIRELLTRLLDKDPERRMASASEAAGFLDRLLAEGDSLAERLEQAHRTPASERSAAPRLPPLERPDLTRAVDDVLAGVTSRKGGVLMLLGHPGSGRSSSLKLIAERLSSAGARIDVEQFVESGVPHMLPLAFLGEQGLLDLEVGAGSHQPDASSEGVTAPSFEGSIELFLDALRQRSLAGRFALLLDDLQFAAEDEFAWLQQLLLLPLEVPLLLILAGDAAAEGAGPKRAAVYGDILTSVATAAHVHSLTLAGLEQALVIDTLVANGVPEQVARTVASSAGGNPGLVNLQLERWHRGEDLSRAPSLVPESQTRQLSIRWQQLEPASQMLLRSLLAAGGRMAIDDLMRVCGLPRLAVKSRLRQLERKLSWVRVEAADVQLTQPFLAALDVVAEPGTTP